MKRFGRLDSARSTPGAGLGMALIEAVARLHDGHFELADNAPGLVARIVLPSLILPRKGEVAGACRTEGEERANLGCVSSPSVASRHLPLAAVGLAVAIG